MIACKIYLSEYDKTTKYYILILMSFLVSVLLRTSYIEQIYSAGLIYYFGQVIRTIIYASVVLIIARKNMMWKEFFNCKCFRVIGKYSFEIFMIHQVTFKIYKFHFPENNFLPFALIILVLAVIALKRITFYINSLFKIILKRECE